MCNSQFWNSVHYSLLKRTLIFLSVINVLLLAIVIFKADTIKHCPHTRSRKFKQTERIVGGRQVGLEKFRFVAGILIIGSKDAALQCGSTIISAYWVISASHCVQLMEDAPIPLSAIYVTSGHQDWKKGKRHKVTQMIKNQYYNHDHLANDTSLFKVEEPFKAPTEVVIPLAGSNYEYKTNSTAIVVGWGFNELKLIQNKLSAVDLLIFSKTFCDKKWKKGFVTEDMFCAGTYEGGKDACQFDSGGPIIQNDVLIGIISWGGECGNKHEPGVYAKMSYFIPWLKNVEETENIKIGYRIQGGTK